ncbi:HyaD/HybD family hydrogenase maturation endopeptidase [Chlorobium phaeobacteroides]|jgi:hydrogenase maturation protease|uniref:Hydrogenase maturation protease n=1 Tax=Chlorobium phaeobacteroides (strain DSM 266 / SMG 266 / 2430) TaxID=290317 RepID=A1BF46_CHLPD|nr:hydrogenase maturation protease [Chlorobium phaeobacteroides DSM 266]
MVFVNAIVSIMQYNRINIIGLGNILFGDEGFGVAVVNSFQEIPDLPECVHCIDGGTQGLALLDYIESCDGVIVFDALIPIDYENRVHVYHKDELPAFIHRKMSSHQMGLSELIGIAKLHGKMPEKFVLIGVPPKNLDLGIGLSQQAAPLVSEAVKAGQEILSGWLEK